LYIPNPKIIDAKVASGIKIKILVLRPMKNENRQEYKVVTVFNQL
jgi:hypothetical protein